MTTETGGELVVRQLEHLGLRDVVGLPGQHSLALFHAVGRSSLRLLAGRVELTTGLMADGAARATGRVVPLLLSAGPGPLGALGAIQEAHDASSPVLVIAAQVPTRGIGGHRHGYLHELADQAAHFRGLVKGAWSVRAVEQIPSVLAQAASLASSAPSGPVYVEIPSDVLAARTEACVLVDAPATVAARPASGAALEAAALLARSERPAILAGGGVVRAGGEAALRDIAARLDAPVVTTPAGRSAMPARHPCAAGGWIEDIATTELLEDADVLLVVGTGVSELSSNYGVLAPRGAIVHVDADAMVLGANLPGRPGVAIAADARVTLEAIDAALDVDADATLAARRRAALRPRIEALATTVAARLDAQRLDPERGLVDDLRAAIGDEVPTFWDMTIAGYWAWSAWDAREGVFECAQSGGLGFGLPAAVGAAFATRRPAVAVSGDGGAMYGVAELATIVQHDRDVVWVIVDDGGYGVLREYLTAAYGETTATELVRPDFVRLADSFGVPATRVDLAGVGAAVRDALATGGPHVIVVDALLRLFAPTHLDRLAAIATGPSHDRSRES